MTEKKKDTATEITDTLINIGRQIFTDEVIGEVKKNAVRTLLDTIPASFELDMTDFRSQLMEQYGINKDEVREQRIRLLLFTKLEDMKKNKID